MAVTVAAIDSANISSRIENPAASRARLSRAACSLTFFVPDHDERLQLQEALLPDALDVHQVLDFFEAAVLLAIVENPLRGTRADAGQALELRLRGRVQVHGRGRGGRGSALRARR